MRSKDRIWTLLKIFHVSSISEAFFDHSKTGSAANPKTHLPGRLKQFEFAGAPPGFEWFPGKSLDFTITFPKRPLLLPEKFF